MNIHVCVYIYIDNTLSSLSYNVNHMCNLKFSKSHIKRCKKKIIHTHIFINEMKHLGIPGNITI